MANARGKTTDTTHLSMEYANEKRVIHRDYLAHAFRWNHIKQYLTLHRRHLSHHVLDVGCGREVPLARVLWHNMLVHKTGSYTGVDVSKLTRPHLIPDTPKFHCLLLGGESFVKVSLPRVEYDTITCFEMLEHVEAAEAYQVLRKIRKLMKPDSVFFVSTPVYSPKVGAAAAHVNEMSYLGFWSLLGLAGLAVKERYGTYASQKDYKHELPPAWRELWDRLADYYSPDVLACWLAPLYPAQSRNVIWRCTPGDVIHFPLGKQELAEKIHGSSKHWSRDIKKILRDK